MHAEHRIMKNRRDSPYITEVSTHQSVKQRKAIESTNKDQQNSVE